MARKIIKLKPRRSKETDDKVRDIFTDKIIPSGKIIDSEWGPIDIKYAIQSNTTGKIYSTKLKSIGTDYFDGEPIDKSNAHIFIIDIIDDKYKYGYVLNRNKLIPTIGTNINPKDGYHRNCNYVLSEEVAEKMSLKESVFDGIWYQLGSFSPSKIPGKFAEFDFPKIDKTSKKDLLKYGMISPTYLISEGKKYSLGIELETSSGLVPYYVYKDLNIKCVYDGSIRDDSGNKRVGGEYVTGVLKGDNGLRHLYKITTELSKRCTLNKTCSVHVHVGGLQFNKEEIVMLWKINQMLEAELFMMMPKSRLIREHCRPMTQLKFNFDTKKASYKVLIDKYYEQIFKIISLGKSPSKTVNKKFNHPAGHSCGYDTSTPRYWWINFVPAMFNLKGEGNNTIEYRMHGASLNFTKIKNWIMICQGITYVAENNKKFLMDNNSITLEEVMKLAYPTKWKYLSSYIRERKETFNGHASVALNERLEYIINRPKGKVSKSLKDTIWD